MAGITPPVIVLPPGTPVAATAPQLPFGSDPGTITGWFRDTSANKMLASIASGLGLGFNCLGNSIPLPGVAGDMMPLYG
jgi:hypothetical protein